MGDCVYLITLSGSMSEAVVNIK